jgi:hypothetical protein
MIAKRMGDRGDKAGVSATPPLTHPLQQRVEREPPPSTPTARHFFIREVGILAEQGVLDRGRMLLARRARDAPDEPEAYLDAMRFELCVPSSGLAWSAWMARALQAGVPVATYIAKIVPERALAPALLEIAPSALLKQADRKSALDLLRLRAVSALTIGDARALDLLEPEALVHAATDGDLAELCMHVLAARAFADPDHVERLGASLDAACQRPSSDPIRAELRAAIALGRSYRSHAIDAPCPAPLERTLGLLGRCDPRADRALLADLERDLRAQPASYLAWADAVASAAPALIDALLMRFGGAAGAESPATSARSDALVLDMAAAIESTALRFLPLPPAEQALYRKHVRLKALNAIVEPGPASQLHALIASAAQQTGSAKRVLALLGSDPALALIDQLALTSALRGLDRETTAHR